MLPSFPLKKKKKINKHSKAGCLFVLNHIEANEKYCQEMVRGAPNT